MNGIATLSPVTLCFAPTNAVVERDRSIFDLDVVEREARWRSGGASQTAVDEVLDVVAILAIAAELRRGEPA